MNIFNTTNKVFAAVAMTTTICMGTSLADAGLIGLHLQQHAVDGNGPFGTVLPGTTTWRLYAEFDDPNDQLTASGGHPAAQASIMSSSGFYQNEFGGPFSSSINPAIYPPFPGLLYDSWITIGAEDLFDNNMYTSNLDTTTFEAGGNFHISNGSWGIPQNDPFAFGVTLPGMSNWHVLVGQFTTAGYGPSSAPWGKMNLSGYSEYFMPGEQVPWSVDGVTFGIPAPGALALLGLAGIALRRRRR